MTTFYDVNECVFLGNFRRDSCNYSPSSSPDVINVAGTQQAEDAPHPGKFVHKLCKYNYIPVLAYNNIINFFRTTYAVLVQFSV